MGMCVKAIESDQGEFILFLDGQDGTISAV